MHWLHHQHLAAGTQDKYARAENHLGNFKRQIPWPHPKRVDIGKSAAEHKHLVLSPLAPQEILTETESTL